MADIRPRKPHGGGLRVRWSMLAVLSAFAFAVATLVIVTVSLRLPRRPAPGLPVERIVEHDGRFGVLSFGDINDDALADLVLGGNGGGEVRVYFGHANRKGPSPPDLRITTTLNADVTGGIVGDVDGDRLPDLVISALLKAPDGLKATGSSYLVRGRRQWPAVLELPRDADVVLAFDLPQDIRMVSCFGRAIDLNGDGLSDVVLGGEDFSPPDHQSAGGIFVLFGRKTWPARIDVHTSFDVAMQGSRTGEGLSSRCGSGDFNGDGRQDLAIAASESTLAGLLRRGRVYVVGGRERWPRVIDVADDAVLAVRGNRPLSELTWPVLADVDGDRVDDLSIGVTSGERNAERGTVAIFRGRSDARRRLLMDEADVLLDGTGPVSQFGDALGADDLNGDGFADLFVGDPRHGEILVVLGRKRWPKQHTIPAAYRPIHLVAGEIGAGAGRLLLGDHDGDGVRDLAFLVDPRRSGSGRVQWTGMLTPR